MKTKINFEIDSSFLFQLSLLLLMLPLRWCLALLIAVTFHEVSHLLATELVGVPVCGITVSAFGVRMKTGSMCPWQEFLASIAGPVGGSILLLCDRLFPEAAICAVVHSIFNLLPIYPFDGGRIVSAICRQIWGEKTGRKLSNSIGLTVCIFVIVISFTTVKYLGLFSMLPVILLVRSIGNTHCITFPKSRMYLTNRIRMLNCLQKKHREGSL